VRKAAFRNLILYDGLYTFALRMAGAVCAAGLGILTARLLGPSGKGLYALPSVEAGLIVSGFTGLGSALSYFLLNRNPGKAVLRPAFIATAVFVAAGALALVPLALLTGRPWTLLPALVSLPSSAAINLASGYAVGVKRVRYSSAINVAVTLLTLVLMAAGLFLVARSATVAIAVWIIAMTVVAAVSIGGVAVHARSLRGSDPVSVGEFMRFTAKVGVVNLVSLLNYRADMYIVALLTSAAQLGMYTVAVSAAESLLVPTQVAALVTSPHIASFELPAAAALTARCVRNNLIVATIVCGVLFALADPIVRLLYGTAFLPMVPALRILLIGVLALSLGSPMSSYFTLKLGRPEVAMYLASASAFVCIAVSLALVPLMGMYGAAIGSTLAYVAGQAAAMWYFAQQTSVGPRQMLVPTRGDVAVYVQFAAHLLRGGRPLGPSSQSR
jgi:O-antigen/teichoic acid export membrane protein